MSLDGPELMYYCTLCSATSPMWLNNTNLYHGVCKGCDVELFEKERDPQVKYLMRLAVAKASEWADGVFSDEGSRNPALYSPPKH